jgi:hypothetical protein
MKDTENEFPSLLPISMNVAAQAFALDIEPVTPMTHEEAVNGREIRPNPYKYDSFDGLDNLEEYLLSKIRDGIFEASWLSYEEIISMPLNLSKDIYYNSVEVFQVTVTDPTQEAGHFRTNETQLFQLNPEDWNLESVKKIINNL